MTRTCTQTPLAARCSPPAEPSVGVLLSLTGFGIAAWVAFKIGGFLGGFWWGVGGFVLTLFLLFMFWDKVLAREAFERHAIAMEDWHRSWVCITCGHAFQVKPAHGQVMS